jgi:hypothetical protein
LSDSTPSRSTESSKDVSLGPACGVVFIFLIAGGCVLIAILSFLLLGQSGKRAAYSVREELIPWIDRSSLSAADRTSMVEQLTGLANQMERDELTARQLSRLQIRFTDAAIFQWGTVEELNRRAQKSAGLSEAEKEEFSAVCDRWLMAAGEGKLSMNEMDFALQGVATKEPQSGRLTVKAEVADDQIRETQRRILAVCEKYKVANEPFDKSPSQVLRTIIEDGLAEK